MIEIKNLSYRYPNSDVAAIDGITVTFPEERVYAVLGDSGSGKTTLLNCLARFLMPSAGSIAIKGREIALMPERVLRRTIGVVFQKLNLFPHLTVLENMTLAPVKAFGHARADAESAARGMLDRLGIGDLGGRYPMQISGGQAQRAAIGRGLMLQPAYMLLDEPTSALDARTTGEFAQWLSELQEDSCFIIVTHDLPFARQVASHGVFLEAGRVKATGEVAAMIEQAT